jgi:hypothetical protein
LSDLGPLLLGVCELEVAGFRPVIGLSPRRATRSSSDLGLLLVVIELEHHFTRKVLLRDFFAARGDDLPLKNR